MMFPANGVRTPAGGGAVRVVDDLPGAALGHALREVAHALQRRGDGERSVGAVLLPVGFGGGKEEGAVAPVVEFGDDDRAAERAGPIAKRLVRDRQAGAIRKEAVGQPVGLPYVAYRAAVQIVRARTQQRIEGAAAGARHFRIVRAGLKLDFLHGFRRRDKDCAIVGIRDGNTVHQNVVGAHRTAGDGDLGVRVLILHAAHLGVGDKHDRLRQFRRKEGVAAQHRQVGDFLAVDDLTGGGVGGLQHRGVGRNVDQLADLSEFQRDVERGNGLGGDGDAALFRPFEARRNNTHRVGGGSERGERIFALSRW